MKSVRIYKDDIRQHILRSLFFTDSTLFISGGVCIAVVLYITLTYIAHAFNWNLYLATLIILEIAFIGFITKKVDNQPIYKIIPRGIVFKKSKKEKRQKELEPYFVDFTIQDNLIVRDRSIVRVFEIEPFDISLLNDQDRENFFVKLKQMIHMLSGQVQFIVQKEKAKTEDYSQHFFSLYANANQKRERLISEYITNLSTLVNDNNFTTTQYLAVFSLSCHTKRRSEKVQAVRKLTDLGMRFTSVLANCNVNVRPLNNQELIKFAQKILR